MAIVINEIEVNLEVIPATSGTAASSAASGSREEIIRECVEKVMEIINQKNER
jgi:hypothetical protein